MIVAIATPQVATSASVDGTVQFSATFTGTGLNFASVAPAGSTTLSLGSLSGPSNSAMVYALPGSTLASTFADVQMSLTSGAGSSITGPVAEARSGAVRVTNGTDANRTLSVNQTLLYALSAAGPGTAVISMAAYIERWNATTLVWDIIGSTSFGISAGQSNSACSPACVGSSGFVVSAGQSWDLRLRSRLQGFASQPAGVPEPGTLGLLLAGLMALGVRARRRRAFAVRR